MVQGTASFVGKSLLVTALCSYFEQQGVKVAPFKAWNMALNSFVTSDGLEIGRAQAVQAEACGLEPSVDMNPILIKCEPDHRMQIVVKGKVVGSMTGEEYRAYAPGLKPIIEKALERLRNQYELVILEGAGSPAELNLKDRDLANMYPAQLADAPVILVGDINRGGVFAALVGTLELLSSEDRTRVKVMVINKFRGNLENLKPGLDLLEQKTGVPVLGILPYLPDLNVAEEDSVALEGRPSIPLDEKSVNIGVIQFPHISNFDDFQPLEKMKEVKVHYIQRPEEAKGMDLVILPGTKATVADLQWLRARGFDRLLQERAKINQPVLGICGGYQMLGERIEDPHHAESEELSVKGLGLLPISTCFEKEKVTAQVEASIEDSDFLSEGPVDQKITAYEIHMGRVKNTGTSKPLFRITSRNRQAVQENEGVTEGAVTGTLLHGLFENDYLRQALIMTLGKKKGLEISPSAHSKQVGYDRLADMVRQHLDKALLDQMIR